MTRLLFGSILLAVLMAGGCVSPVPASETTSSGSTEMATPASKIRVAVLPITDVVPFYVASQQGFFTDAGIEVELVPVSSGAERDTVVQTGAADCEVTDIHGVVLTNDSGILDLKVIATARQATPDQPVFFLLTSPGSNIAEPAQLSGAAIGISENTIIEYWSDRMLAADGVDPGAITKTNVPQIPVRLELLLNGQLDAAILPDPLASLAQLQGATLLLDDTSNPDVAASVIACRQDAIDVNSAAVEALLAGWDAAVDAINADPEAYRNVLIENTRVPEPLQDNYALPQFPVKAVPSPEQVVDVVDWALQKGLVETELAYDEVVDASYR